MQSLFAFFDGNLDSASYWIKQAIGVSTDPQAISGLWIEYLEYNLLSENHAVLEELEKSPQSFSEKSTILATYQVVNELNRGSLLNAMDFFKNFAPPVDSECFS